MKFNFDNKKYRESLSKNLKEKKSLDKEKAQEYLKKKQDTPEYIISEIIHSFEDKGLMYKKSDHELKNQLENFEVEDISESIPKEIALAIDYSRIEAILSKIEKGRQLPDHISNHKYNIEDLVTLKNKLKNLMTKEYEFGTSVFESKLDFFLNKLSDGKYLDNRNLNHSVGGFNDFSDNLSQVFGSTVYPEIAKHTPWPLAEFGTRQTKVGEGIWLSAGKNEFVSPTKTLILYSLENKGFKRVMKNLWNVKKKEFFENNESIVEKALEYIRVRDKDGKELYDVSFRQSLAEEQNRDLPFNEYRKERNYGIYNEGPKSAMLPFCVLNGLPLHTDRDKGAFVNIQYHEEVIMEDRSWFDIADLIIDLEDSNIFRHKSN